jgi:hypothetical protein
MQVIKYDIIIAKYRFIPRQRLCEHIPAEAYAHSSKISITRQRISKETFSTIGWLRFLRDPCRGIV